MTALASAAPVLAAPSGAAEGLWAYHVGYDPGPAGELTLSRDGGRWRATIAGRTASGAQSGDKVQIDFPGGGGSFRGRLLKGELHGFWVRRAIKEDPGYPFGQALSYATPLKLSPAGPSRWRASVKPFQDTFTLYLKVFRDADGSLKAAFRNPEQNAHGPAMQLTVAGEGDDLRFEPPADSDTKTPIIGRMLHGPDRISVAWPDPEQTIELKRTSEAAAERYLPRPKADATYAYRPPADTGDGWRVARAGALGVDEAQLAKVVRRIAEVDPAGPRPWMIHSVAVAYKGRLILDEYFYGYGREEPHDTRSASKTFSSVMLGALVREGAAIGPESKVYEIMAPRGPFANPDPRKDKIALRHLLSHSAGLACDDNDEKSPGYEDKIEADRSIPDWAQYTLNLPMAYEPGRHYAYCSMNINLAAAALTQASGEWLPALFDRTVAEPLQFGAYHWNLMPNGEGYLGGGVLVRTRDFLKLGQAYMDGGVWNGRRIVSEDWVKYSIQPQMHISPETTGLSGDAFFENYWEGDDALAWHFAAVKSGDKIFRGYHANGNGGQLLVVLPQFELAVMFTAGNYAQGLWNRERDDILGGMILPALPGYASTPASPTPGRGSR